MLGNEPTEVDPASLAQAFGSYAAKNTAVIVEPLTIASWDHTKLRGAY
jgi:hypothetical protein